MGFDRKEFNKKYGAEYRKANREKARLYAKEYLKANYEKHLEDNAKWRELNKEKVSTSGKRYYQNTKQSRAQYKKEKMHSDPSFKLMQYLRTRQNNVLRGKCSTTEGLGCNKDFLKVHLEGLFLEGMSWDNYGNKAGCWSLDHILPLNSFERTEDGSWDTNSTYNKNLIHYTNLQPMWHLENIKKSDKIIGTSD